MNYTDLAPHLAQLLYQHDTIVLPGLGAFQTQAASAGVDYAGSSLTPPAKTLIFNENLATDDGLLMQQIAQSQGVSFEEASQLIESAVLHVQTLLDQREIVAIPGIGRLYKNYVQKIQFLPDAQNFSRENFGLPPLQFSPIARSREVTDAPAAVTTTTAPAASSQSVPTAAPTKPTNVLPAYEPESSGSGLSLSKIGLVLLLLGVSAGIGYWVWQRQQAKLAAQTDPITALQDSTSSTTAVPESTTNTPATTPEPPAAQPSKTEVTATEAPKTQQPTATPSATPPSKGPARECILIVGLFKDANNIARLEQLITKLGMEVYKVTSASGASTVGGRFEYTDPAEVQTRIGQLQKATGEKNIRVKKK
jgi:cell division septation protein DedD